MTDTNLQLLPPKTKLKRLFPKNNVTNLDTLAQLAPSPKTGAPSHSKNVLLKRARSKYISNSLALRLADLKSKLQQSYYNTFHCCNDLTQLDQTITAKYCNNRWCLTCNRIRTAKLIKGYAGPLKELKDKRFVTLTIPNVSSEQLQETLATMLKTFQLIKKAQNKTTNVLRGIRKLEITFNPVTKMFHPHFHLIMEGEQTGNNVIAEWLKRYPSANRDAQDNKAADDDSTMELFKYFTKIVTKKRFEVGALNTIFESMYGKRTFQSFGIKKDVSEDVEGIQSMIYEDLIPNETLWTWIDTDWIDESTGECLTGYEPSENVKKLVNFGENCQRSHAPPVNVTKLHL